jgi:hypothetical protein
MTATFWLFCGALAALVPLTVVRAPAPPSRPLHRVQLKQHARWFKWLTYVLPYRARQITREDFGGHVDRMKVGIPAEESAAQLAQAAFVPAWWHIGPLAPAAFFRNQPPSFATAMFGELAKSPTPTRED